MICSFCSANLSNFRNYRAHLIDRHKIQFDKNGNCKSLFLCKEDHCNFSFDTFFAFKSHVKQFHAKTVYFNPLPCLAPEQIPTFIAHENIPTVPQPPDNLDLQVDVEMLEEDSDDSDSGETVPEMTLELGRELINQIVCELRCKTNLSHVLISSVVNMMIRIALIISLFLKNQVICLLRCLNVDLNCSKVVELLNVFDNVNCFFKNTETFKKQLKHNLQHINYVAPEEILLGKRTDTVLKNNENVRKEVKESLQYISIKSTLMALYRNKSFVKIVEKEKRSTPGIFKSFIDGRHFQSKNYFVSHKHALRINLYFDDLEVCNANGSQSSVHKIGCFYYTIQNATTKYNSKLENIFILAICYSSDIKKYGFDKILEKFIQEMEELESENGVEFFVGNQKRTLRATLVSFIGDTLAAHDVLGFSGPGSKKFCRECLISREQFHKNPTCRAEKRTATLHSEHLQELTETNYHHSTIKKFGVKENSVLNRLKNFHCSESNVFDPMHDLLEGVVPFTLKCVLKYFIQKRCLFSVFDFNVRVNNFRYGFVERCNKPSPNFTQAMLNSKSKKLKQKSSQCWLLLRVFPFLVGNLLVNSDFKYIDLLVTLSKICEISFSTTLNEYKVCELDFLIKSYLTQFKKLFGDKKVKGKIVKGVTMINKHHHLLHYTENIMLKGPIALYSCMRFEGKHLPIKKQIIFAQNFINVPFSVASRQSLQQSFNIKYNCFKKSLTLATSSKLASIENLLSAEIVIEKFGLQPFVNKISSCIVRGVEYRPNFVFYIKDDRNDTMYPSFVILKEMIEMHNEIYFFCHRLNIIENSYIYNAFEVEETTDVVFLKGADITDYNPVNIWRKYDSESKFFNIKYCY
jgi:hypothetical protein